MLAITFLMAWSGAVAAWALEAAREGRRWIVPTAVWATVLVLVFSWGVVRLQSNPVLKADAQPQAGSAGTSDRQAHPVTVTGLTAQAVSMHELMPLLAEDLAGFRQRTAEIHAHYLEQSEAAARDGANLVVWPELAGLGTTRDVEALTARAAELATRHGVYLVVPTMSVDPDGNRQAVNQAVLLGPAGTSLAEHVKFGGNFMEGTLPGDEQVTFADTTIGRIGLAICWDADFPAIVSQAGRHAVDILVVPAADWSGIDPLHGHMAVFRAVENGTTLVRQAQGGLSIIADPYGRVVDRGAGPSNAVRASVTRQAVTTIYPRVGDVLGPVSAAAVLIVAIVVLVRRRSRRRGVDA